MDNPILPQPAICYVCIFCQKNPPHIYIVYGTDWNYTSKNIPTDAELLYLRPFDNLLDGIGHKAILEHLPTEDLKQLILSRNSRQVDLRPMAEAILPNQVNK